MTSWTACATLALLKKRFCFMQRQDLPKYTGCARWGHGPMLGIVCCTDTNARLMHLNGILHKDMQRHTLTPAPRPIYVYICIRIHTYVPTPNASAPSFHLSRHCLSLMRRSRATFIVALSQNPPWKGNPRNVPCARGLPTCETLMFCTCGQTAAQIFPKDGLQAK